MSKKIAVLITDEFEDSEFTSPADEFRKAGHEVITIEKQAGKTVKGKKGEASVTIDKSIDEVTPAEFDALLLPGGHSPDYLRGDNRFVTFTRDFVNSGKPVFAICHGPQLLISADVIRGRKLTAVKPIIIDVKNDGRGILRFRKSWLIKISWLPAGHRTICQRLTARRYACSVPESRSQIHFFTKAQRVVGEFDFIEPDFPHRGRQHSGNRKATIVRLAREVAFLTFQPADLTFKLHTAN